MLPLPTLPVRLWRLARGRCPWCDGELTEVTICGRAALAVPHTQSKVRYCLHYHYFSLDSWPRTPLRTRLAFEDADGHLPNDLIELIDSLRYAVTRVALGSDVPDVDRRAGNDEATDCLIRSSERLQSQLLDNSSSR